MSENKLQFDAKKEKRKLKAIFKNVAPECQRLVAGLIEDAAFMGEQLEILRNSLVDSGWSEEYQNGANQKGRKSCPEGDAYLKLQKNYAATIKQLHDFLPSEKERTSAKAGDALNAFIAAGKPGK